MNGAIADGSEIISSGVMAKGGTEYTTPTVYDTFDQGNIACGW